MINGRIVRVKIGHSPPPLSLYIYGPGVFFFMFYLLAFALVFILLMAIWMTTCILRLLKRQD